MADLSRSRKDWRRGVVETYVAGLAATAQEPADACFVSAERAKQHSSSTQDHETACSNFTRRRVVTGRGRPGLAAAAWDFARRTSVLASLLLL